MYRNRNKFLRILIPFAFALIYCKKSFSQDTFSIVAADSVSREVGSAGASCLDLFTSKFNPDFIGDLIPNVGAINTQSYFSEINQKNARLKMLEGLMPSEIISWLLANDNWHNPQIRQYGIVAFKGTKVISDAFTGSRCLDYKNHKKGSINGIYYSIQGNVLLGKIVIDSMESKFRNAKGDLSSRLMAALQGAKFVGADIRCASNGTSALFAFLKVAKPTDAYGYPSFSISVKTHAGENIEPIDSLQSIFNAQYKRNSL